MPTLFQPMMDGTCSQCKFDCDGVLGTVIMKIILVISEPHVLGEPVLGRLAEYAQPSGSCAQRAMRGVATHGAPVSPLAKRCLRLGQTGVEALLKGGT